MSVKKKIIETTGAVSRKGVTLTEDVTNMQLNREKKKAFKNQQKEERKKCNLPLKKIVHFVKIVSKFW